MGFSLIIWICLGLAFPLFLTFCIRFPKGNMEVHRATPLVLLTILSTVTEITLFYIGINTPLYTRIYSIFEFAVIYYFFYFLTENKKALLFFLVIFIFTYLYFTIGWDGRENLTEDLYFILIEFIMVFHFSLFWYVKLFSEMKVDNLFKNSDFFYRCGATAVFQYYLFCIPFDGLFGEFLL